MYLQSSPVCLKSKNLAWVRTYSIQSRSDSELISDNVL